MGIMLDAFLFKDLIVGSFVEGYLVQTDYGIGNKHSYHENAFRINIYGTNQ